MLFWVGNDFVQSNIPISVVCILLGKFTYTSELVRVCEIEIFDNRVRSDSDTVHKWTLVLVVAREVALIVALIVAHIVVHRLCRYTQLDVLFYTGLVEAIKDPNLR